MNRESIWTTRDGQRLKIKDMDTNHIQNSARLILRKGFGREYLEIFLEELKLRGEDFSYEGSMYDGSYISFRSSVIERDRKKTTSKKSKKEWNIIQRPKSAEAK